MPLKLNGFHAFIVAHSVLEGEGERGSFQFSILINILHMIRLAALSLLSLVDLLVFWSIYNGQNNGEERRVARRNGSHW